MKANKIGEGYKWSADRENDEPQPIGPQSSDRPQIALTPLQRGLIHAGLTIAVFCAADKIGGAIRNKIGDIFR